MALRPVLHIVPESVPPTPKAGTAWFYITEEIDPKDPPLPTIRNIQDAVCKHYLVPRNDLISPRRNLSIIIPRHVAIYLSRTLTRLSYPVIGRKFGLMDHTSVLSAHRKIERLASQDLKLAADVAAIAETILTKWGK